MAKLLGPRSCTACAGQTGEQIFLHWKWNFHGMDWKLLPTKAAPLLCSILLSFISLWVKIWHRNKTTCSKSNPVQSSNSKRKTGPRKGRLLRFESNSKATSDDCTQKLGNYVKHDSESIATRVCSQIGCKWNVMFESHVVTSVDRTSFDFRFEDFLSYLTW